MYLIFIFGLILNPLISAESDKPLLQELLVPKTSENQTVRLVCASLQGESLSFEWYLNNEKIEHNSRRKIISHEGLSELIIKSLSVDDIGEISCIAQNKFGKDTSKSHLSFNAKPKWLKEPQDLTGMLYKEITLECSVKSHPSSVIQWIKISDNKQTLLKELKESNILKFELTKDTAGSYKCIASNLIGSIQKSIDVTYFGK